MSGVGLRGLVGLLAGLMACALLLGNTASRRAHTNLKELHDVRRLWDDQAIGITRYLVGRDPIEANPEAALLPAETQDVYQQLITSRVRLGRIRPWQPWRTLPDGPFLGSRSALAVPKVNDPGRAIVLAAGFRLLGGISPFLVLWVGPLCCLPLLLWVSWEMSRAGYPVAGAAFVLLFACSPYVVETLSLARSAVGFYLVALLALVALAAYAALGQGSGRLGFLSRVTAAGTVLGVCALCRGGCLFLIPGFLLAVGLGSARVFGNARGFLLGMALLLVPYGLLWQPQHHDAWQSIWEGLGDFDRSKGHAWADSEALKVIQQSGGRTLRSPRGEEILRDAVVRHVREDPGWFLGILGKRVTATVLQSKLRPWGPWDGRSMAPSESPNEGVLDKYYSYTTTVDFIGFGAWQAELPLLALLAPTVLLVLLAAAPRSPLPPGSRERALRSLRLLACVALAALPVPVLISTAGGQDTQAFALVYFLGFAFVLEEACRSVRVRNSLPRGLA